MAFKKQEAVLLLLRDNQVIIRLANSDNTALCHQLRLTIVWCTSVESTPVSADTILVCDNHSTVSLTSLGPPLRIQRPINQVVLSWLICHNLTLVDLVRFIKSMSISLNSHLYCGNLPSSAAT